MRVAGPDAGRLAELLRGRGAAWTTRATARSSSTAAAARTSRRGGRAPLVISELSPIASSLEEIFFQLTGEPGAVV